MKYLMIVSLFFSLIQAKDTNSVNPLGTLFGMSEKIIKAKKIYRNNFKKKCRFTGSVLARMHTKDEWEALKENKQFKDEIYRQCPQSKYIIKDEWVETLYYFMYHYASDAGIFPKC